MYFPICLLISPSFTQCLKLECDAAKRILYPALRLQVTKDTFLSVVAGNAEALKGKGTGKVLGSGEEDRVFFFYSDHGSVGVLCFPDGVFLYADELVTAFEQRYYEKGFKELVAYVESCESGSMFKGFENQMPSVYAMTASNAMESSWATYCPSKWGQL